jgi:hypothetical protein
MMAWLDDRVWCHPKLADVSDKAFRAYINSIAYSSGFSLKGHLTPGQLTAVGATARVRTELEDAGLWDPNGNGIMIHDWEEHNAKRDEKRVKDRERKRAYRDRLSRGQDVGQTTGQEAGQDEDIQWDK